MLAGNALCGLICSLNGFGYICKQANSNNKVAAIEYICNTILLFLFFLLFFGPRAEKCFYFLQVVALEMQEVNSVQCLFFFHPCERYFF